ncbi:hypothetical protein Zm00014a_020697 [Zea mays]|uniref:Uncharacterized protein n=1 Tax=Zea mays TaxID=4577 RepID=A0A3L6FTJ0_MAIZE|nr:hypothetical protein Zm00014a_020697 [Zea mays]
MEEQGTSASTRARRGKTLDEKFQGAMDE